MTVRDNDFHARMKRVKARSGGSGPMPAAVAARRTGADERGEHAAIIAILRPQLALVLGVIAMIAGRAFAMNSLGIEPNTEVLSAGEGAVVLALLAGIGLLLFRKDMISLVAMVAGAALGFLLEGYFIPAMPGLMSEIYDPAYVGLVVLNAG